ncbi:hypothetical protein Patl1_29823 [Pistacia atlantica]|uniref:Uncharacterized protein n=1 Tax=Pistacia atlantica TaxID=434234 RepID=A0ACC1ACT0_9ROSI|nr:hypothetical protein Patl1_29823 [Pistacia atlantica]
MTTPQIAILGAGIFVKTQYVPRLSEISDIVSVKFIWSRSEESAKSAVEIARKHFGGVEAVWGDQGLDRIINDDSILGVAVVLAGQFQVSSLFSCFLLLVWEHCAEFYLFLFIPLCYCCYACHQ